MNCTGFGASDFDLVFPLTAVLKRFCKMEEQVLEAKRVQSRCEMKDAFNNRGHDALPVFAQRTSPKYWPHHPVPFAFPSAASCCRAE